jgi:hypothetical protein
MNAHQIQSSIAPRQLASFMNELVTNAQFRQELETNTSLVFEKYGITIDEDSIPEIINLPEMKELGKIVGEYLQKEKFAFPAQHSIQMGFPLAFALVVVFVFIPTPAYKLEKVA